MSSLINPATARLGITRTWVINYPITLSANFPIIESYRLQSYLYCLHSFAHLIFAERYHRQFYMNLFIIFNRIHFNQTGFPSLLSHNLPKLKLTFTFFDFFAHVNNYNNYGKIFKRVSQKFRFKVQELALPLRDLYNHPSMYQFYGFFYNFAKALIEMKLIFKEYYKQFNFLLRKTGFKLAFIRIHRFFFFKMPIVCSFQVHPYLGKVSAKFIAIYLERKVRTGTHIYRALKLVHKYLRQVRHVIGYRIICAGRFQRGKKAGFLSRSVGIFSYGRYSKSHFLDYATSSTDLKTGICGFKVWLCSSPFIDDRKYITPFNRNDRF